MKKRLLTDTEACIHLGITKELLYAYIKNAPKTALKNDRTLISEDVNGVNMFDENELNLFDEYLKEPWSKKGEKRPKIPTYIQDYLSTEINGQCPITKKGNPLENSHIVDYSVSRSHHHHNIIRIAKDVHTKYDTGVLPKENLRKAKDRLIEGLRHRLKIESGAYGVSVRSPKPHQLFVGRDRELIEVVEAIGVKRLVVIEGIGGVGKTQLLLNAIDVVENDDPLIWIDIETITTLDDLILLITNEISKIEGVSVEGSLIDTLSTVRITIVLDSLENLLISYRDEVEDFIQLLMTRTAGVQLLITSQIDLSIFDHEKALIKLEGISDVSTKAILDSVLNNSIELDEQQLEWILRFCEGHPLSIKLTSAIINFYTSADKAINHLEQSDSLKHPLRRKLDKSNALSICLNTIYSALNTDQRDILRLTKFFPSGAKLDWAKLFLKLNEFEFQVATLQQFFLVEIGKDLLGYEKIIVQNPLRKFLYDKSKEESKEDHFEYEKEIFLGISFEAKLINQRYIETSSEGSAEYGILRMESELLNIMEAFHNCRNRLKQKDRGSFEKLSEPYSKVVENISSALGKYFFIRGFLEQGILMSRVGINISIENEMYEIAAIQYIYLSQFQTSQFDFAGVEQCILEVEELFELTKNNYLDIARCWMKGRHFEREGDNKKALEYLSNAKNLMKERIDRLYAVAIVSEDLSALEKERQEEIGNLGLVYSEIGDIYLNDGEFQKALEYYNRGLEIQLELKNETNALGVYYQIANCYVDLGQLEKAIKYYFDCVDGNLRHGNHADLANTMAELGRNVEFVPEIAMNELLSEHAFKAVFFDLNNRIKSFVENYKNQNGAEIFRVESMHDHLLGQMVLLMKLAAFTEHRKVLLIWSLATRKEMEFEIGGVNPFTATLNLAHWVGTSDQWIHLSKEEHESRLRQIFVCCLIVNDGPDINSGTRIFHWLARWFRYVKLDEEATAEKLSKQALN